MNRYHGKEWPCSPARLFRALLAGSMTGGNRKQQETIEPALQWLEKLPAPVIHAVPERDSEVYRISVPNNDMDIAAREWAAGRSYDASVLRTMKRMAPKLLPDQGPHLVYRWPGVEMDEVVHTGLRAAVNALHTLGLGIDMAFADLALGDQERKNELAKWTPEETGSKVLALPTEGSLQDLKEAYSRFLGSLTKGGVNPDTRPSVYRFQSYSSGYVAPESIAFDLVPHSDDAGRSAQRKSFPSESGMKIAAWLRHAAAEALRQEKYPEQLINEIALGHNETEPNANRLAYVPLPSVGFRHADGRVSRVLIALRGSPELLELLERKLNGWMLTDKDGQPKCSLARPANRRVTPFYLNARREWESVTPVILHGYNATGGTVSMRKTDKLLAQAFSQAGHGLDNIDEWAIQAAPLWPNTPGARSIRVPMHLRAWPRYHVAVKFRNAIQGPVLAGLGRHYGLGVFAGTK
jgi:CRISPR-associated protein Csb2